MKLCACVNSVRPVLRCFKPRVPLISLRKLLTGQEALASVYGTYRCSISTAGRGTECSRTLCVAERESVT